MNNWLADQSGLRRKGLAGMAYATELRLLVGWRFELCDNGSITLDTIESWGNEHLRTSCK